MLKQFAVIFHDGKGKVVLAKSKEDVRQKYKNVRSVFRMGVLK